VRWPCLVALLVVGSACADPGETVLVRFLSPRSIPDQADRLDVAVVSMADGALLEQHSYPLAGLAGFPAVLEIVRGRATPPQIRIDASLYLGSGIVAGGSTGFEFVAGPQRQIDLPLADVPQVRGASSGTSSGAPSLVIDRPEVADGDVLVALVAHDAGTDFFVPAPSGWTYVSTLTANVYMAVRTYVFWKRAGAAEPASYSFTPAPAYSLDMTGGMWSIASADATNPIGASLVEAHETATTTCTAPGITTSAPSVLLYACARTNSVAQSAPPAGTTEDWDRTSGTDPMQSMALEGAHELDPVPGATGTRSSSPSPGSLGSGEIALLIAIAARAP